MVPNHVRIQPEDIIKWTTQWFMKEAPKLQWFFPIQNPDEVKILRNLNLVG